MSKPIGVGDKCLLIKSNRIANRMKVVLVVAKAPQGQFIDMGNGMRGIVPHGMDFEVESLGTPFEVVNPKGEVLGVKSLFCKADQLRRLDDDDKAMDRDVKRELESLE